MKIASMNRPDVRRTEASTSVLAAAAAMKRENVGTLVVVDARGEVEGFVTDRDLVVRVLAEGRDPARTQVADVMTRHPRTIAAEASLEDALASMQELGVRRLPVVGARGEIVGMLSVDDIVRRVASELEGLARILAHGAPGVRPPAVRPSPRVRDFAGLERAASDPEC